MRTFRILAATVAVLSFTQGSYGLASEPIHGHVLILGGRESVAEHLGDGVWIGCDRMGEIVIN